MSKKLVNSPERCVDEALAGLVASQPGLRLVQGHRVVVRMDVARLAEEKKVTLLSGGGSGHEPAHAGFVGPAMLTAAVAGAVFASPPPTSILAALRAIKSPAGSLMIVKNYTGDRLNFGIALERAKAEGMDVQMVVVGEDAALPSEGKLAGRRGLCGTILVHKIAGAAAEEGRSLQEVAALAQHVADNIATMSVSLSPCSVPGHKPSFTLEDDEMELGLGIHGEAGAERTKLESADRVVERMLKHLFRDDPGYQYFKTDIGMEVALVVNNMGGTSNLELSVVTNAAIRYLVDTSQLQVVRVYTGSLMTSLEMAGVSLTLLRLSPGWHSYLDTPTTAPGWPMSSLGEDGTKMRVESNPIPCQTSPHQDNVKKEPLTNLGRMVRRCVEGVCGALVEAEEELNELDRGSGDGDCGSTLKAGCTAIMGEVGNIGWDSPQKALLSVASIVETHMGGTSGALYALFLTSGANAVVSSWSEPASWAVAVQEGLQAIIRYGGAERGHRTMVDALGPAVDVLVMDMPTASGEQSLTVLQAAVKAASDGAEATVQMKAMAGRSSYVHSSHLVNPDPGARAVALWFEAVYKILHTATDLQS